jgi:hypothetical protein
LRQIHSVDDSRNLAKKLGRAWRFINKDEKRLDWSNIRYTVSDRDSVYKTFLKLSQIVDALDKINRKELILGTLHDVLDLLFRQIKNSNKNLPETYLFYLNCKSERLKIQFADSITTSFVGNRKVVNKSAMNDFLLHDLGKPEFRVAKGK